MLLTSARWLQRILVTVLVLGGLAFASLVLGLRYWVLPNISEYRETIAASIGKAAGQRVSIGQIGAGWDGLRPHLTLRQVEVYDRAGNPALRLEHIEGTLAWWSLPLGEVRLHLLEIDHPTLALRRTASGEIYVGGVWVNQPGTESGFVDWVLRQHRIIVRNATLTWDDAQRGAPLLELRDAQLRLENRGRHHRFGLRAVPPPELALPLDIRGDLKGSSMKDLAGWSGTLYAQLDHTDIAAWRAWFDLPVQVERGFGGVRAWLTVGSKRLWGATVDLQLNDVLVRMAADLPQLDLRYLGGRLGWTDFDPGQSVNATRLGFAIRNGPVFEPASVRLKLIPEKKDKPARGEFAVDRMVLQPLAALAEYLPLAPDLRAKLRELQPEGTARELELDWEGAWPAPRQFTVKGKFDRLGMRPYPMTPDQRLPGFSGLTCDLDATEKGGTLAVKSQGMKLELPGIFDHSVDLDTLTAQLDWSKKGKEHEFRLSSASISNQHLAGTGFGTYKTKGTGPGVIDLSARFNRADARFVYFYMPLIAGKDVRDWLERSLKAGHSNDTRLRLKGDLADFPFSDGKSGLFEVSVKGTGAVLEYAPDWPVIEGIGVDLLFHGKSMDIVAHAGHTYGMQLGKVRVRIPDLLVEDELLTVDGDARGPTADMLKFIARSPVDGILDGFTRGMRAQGGGRFALSLKIPLRRVKDMTVAGNYQFQNDQIGLGDGMPALERVNGVLQFSDSSVTMPGITAQFLGGPANIRAATRDGTVQVNASGYATAAGLSGAFDNPMVRHLSGGASWSAQIGLRKKSANVVVSSNLQGLGSDLPAPFAKNPSDNALFRLERKMVGEHQDAVLINYGKLLAAELDRREQGGEMKVDRGAIVLGGGPVRVVQSGVWLSGAIPTLDLDAWRRLSADNGGGGGFAVDGINLGVGALDAFGKRFNDFRVTGTAKGDSWQMGVASREMSGNVVWERGGAGRVTAHFKRLALAPSASAKPAEAATERTPADSKARENLPALDVVADSFAMGRKELGHLELLAAPNGRDWRIERLRLTAPDSTITLDGVWQDWLQQPRSRINVKLEASDVGSFLGRVGYPGTVKGGEATLDGHFYWVGSPADFNVATLSGIMTLTAKKGRFLKIDPGIGKLLGVLSLQSLPRRITLDFSDVFSQGFAFDEINSGEVKVSQGIMRGRDFKMEGPAAKVTMSGETNLVAETQDLHVKVVPVLSDTVAGAAMVLNPWLGPVMWVLQRAAKDPLGQIIAYEYNIGGTWDNPQVEKVRKDNGDGKQWDGN